MDTRLMEWGQRIARAAAQGQRLQLCGGGSKAHLARWAPGSGPDAGPDAGQVLDTRAYAGIVSHEPTELVVTVRCGTPLAELEAVLAEQQQYLPFEPPHFSPHATVGGMVASALAGPARASVGGLRDYVLGVRMFNGQGQDLHFGGQVMKNVAGYDVSRLMAGSWGSLGLITEVSLKVLPLPRFEATWRFALGEQAALDALNHWGALPLPLNASVWQQHPERGPELFVRLRGAQAAVEAAPETLAAAPWHGHCIDLGPMAERLTLMPSVGAAPTLSAPSTSHSAAAHWQALREQRQAFFTPPSPAHALLRLSLPQTAPALARPQGVAAPLIEWHGGLRWTWATASQAPALYALTQQHGGHARIERPPQDPSLPLPPTPPLDPTLAALHQRIQTAFDPQGVFACRGPWI